LRGAYQVGAYSPTLLTAVHTSNYFLRELKEEGLIHVMWKDGSKMSADIFTKNATGPIFNKHASRYVK
jgi:hypothetical protein